MLIAGILMIGIGVIITSYLNFTTPMGEAGMTEGEVLDFLTAHRENADYKTLSGILIGIGFLFVLISFGARRKRKGSTEKIEKKPSQ